MSDGYEIMGKRMTDSALLPWSIGSLARALLFYGQAQAHTDRRTLTAVATYYSLFHLGMFLIYTCPKHQTDKLKSEIQVGIRGGSDPNRKVSHTALRKFLDTCNQQGLSPRVYDAFVKAQKIRDFINYGPRVYLRGSGEIFIDTCAHYSSELVPLQSQLAGIFCDAVQWACAEGADDGIWVLIAINEVQGFFAGSGRYYADWCMDEEAHIAESLRISLEEKAKRRAYGNKK